MVTSSVAQKIALATFELATASIGAPLADNNAPPKERERLEQTLQHTSRAPDKPARELQKAESESDLTPFTEVALPAHNCETENQADQPSTKPKSDDAEVNQSSPSNPADASHQSTEIDPGVLIKTHFKMSSEEAAFLGLPKLDKGSYYKEAEIRVPTLLHEDKQLISDLMDVMESWCLAYGLSDQEQEDRQKAIQAEVDRKNAKIPLLERVKALTTPQL